MIGLVSLITYWVVEPDPLQMTIPVGHAEWVVCDKRVFSFQREFINTKTIDTIRVGRKLKNLDTGETFLISSISYEGIKSNSLTTFKTTIPLGFTKGNYLYIPTAIYKVNPIKTIEKQLPTQKVIFLCED
jgi:hypothetical protein